jgi:hypothetical protein
MWSMSSVSAGTKRSRSPEEVVHEHLEHHDLDLGLEADAEDALAARRLPRT